MDDKGKRLGLPLHLQVNPNDRKNSILLRSSDSGVDFPPYGNIIASSVFHALGVYLCKDILTVRRLFGTFSSITRPSKDNPSAPYLNTTWICACSSAS